MDSPVNIHHYLCSQPETPVHSPCQFLLEVTDEELFQSMDEVINQKYPDDHTYDIEDEVEEPPLKKPRVPENSFDQEQKIKLVKRMYGCKESVNFFTSTEDRTIQERIETIFRQMKQTVK